MAVFHRKLLTTYITYTIEMIHLLHDLNPLACKLGHNLITSHTPSHCHGGRWQWRSPENHHNSPVFAWLNNRRGGMVTYTKYTRFPKDSTTREGIKDEGRRLTGGGKENSRLWSPVVFSVTGTPCIAAVPVILLDSRCSFAGNVGRRWCKVVVRWRSKEEGGVSLGMA